MSPTVAFQGDRGRPLRILHTLLTLGEESCYNQFCLPARDDVSIVTFFRAELTVPGRIRLYEGDGSVRGFFRALHAALRANPHDVVHAHGPVDGFLVQLFALFSRRRMRGAVFTAHHSFTNSNLKPRNRLLLLPIFAVYPKVVCVSEASLDSFPAVYRRLAGDRLSVVHNGVDVDRVARNGSARRRGLGGQDFTVVSVGRLIAIKNPLTVLAAFGQGLEPPCRLLLVGQGELGDEISRAGRVLGDARPVSLTGRIPRDEVHRLLAEADLFVSASRGEGMPIAVLEAMASGCPVVLSDIPAHQEIAAAADFIPLIDPEDVSGFARTMAEFRRMSSSERARIGERCRRLVEERFSLSGMQEGYGAVYRDLITGGPALSPRGSQI